MKNPQMVPFLLTTFSLFKMVPFLLAKFWTILKWYHFKPPFSAFPRPKGGFILGGLRGLNVKSLNGTFFVDQF